MVNLTTLYFRQGDLVGFQSARIEHRAGFGIKSLGNIRENFVASDVFELGNPFRCERGHLFELTPKHDSRLHKTGWEYARTNFVVRLFQVEDRIVTQMGPG